MHFGVNAILKVFTFIMIKPKSKYAMNKRNNEQSKKETNSNILQKNKEKDNTIKMVDNEKTPK